MKAKEDKDILILQAVNNGRYSVDERGSIWSHVGKLPRRMKESTLKNGYKIIEMSISGKTFMAYVHRVVALAKHVKKDECIEVNHKDGCKSNNSPENLEWVTPKENTKHAIKNGLRGNRSKSVGDGFSYIENQSGVN